MGSNQSSKCLRSRALNALTDVADVAFIGREFHKLAPECEMLFLNKSTRGQGTTKERLFRSDRCDTVERLNKLDRYAGALEFMTFHMNTPLFRRRDFSSGRISSVRILSPVDNELRSEISFIARL